MIRHKKYLLHGAIIEDMDIWPLKYFLAVARAGNLTRAAETLHISQPALSMRLIELERELGHPLFLRGPRGMALTEQGALLMRRAEDLCGNNTGIIAYGRLPFMIMRDCVKGGSGNICGRKGKTAFLTDRMKKDFLLTCEFGCRNRLWNADVLWLADKELPKFGFIRLVFTDESPEEARGVIDAYAKKNSPPPVNMTRGRYYS